MRQSLYALATAAFLLGACGEQPQTSTPAAPPTTVKASVGSPVTPSGKTRIALLLPLSGSAAPIGQAMQQAAEMALFDTGAKELALAAYDSGDSAETAMEAYRKARTDGVAMVLGPLFGTSAKALAPWWRKAAPTSCPSPTTRPPRSAASGSWASPPRRRCAAWSTIPSKPASSASPPSRRRHPTASRWSRALESQATIRGATVAGVELYDPNSADLGDIRQTPGGWRSRATASSPSWCRWRRRACRPLLAALGAAGLDNKSVQFIGTGVWDVPNVGSDAMARGAWYAAPDPARRDDFERRFLATYGRPPNRLATLAYDGVALAGNLARLKPGGDFSAEAITNPNGWSGVDGIFRFLPDGRSERALAVIEVQGSRGTVVSPAPTTFAAANELSDMPVLPRAILFDLDDTLIRAYAQPEDAWRRLLHVFAAHLDAHDAATIERVRVADHGRGARLLVRLARPPPSGGSTLRAPGGCRCGAASPGWGATTRRWPIASPMPSPRCGATNTSSIPTPTPPSTPCARPASSSRW